MGPLCRAIKDKDAGAAHHWRKSEEWGTVEQLMAAQGGPTEQKVSGGAYCWSLAKRPEPRRKI